MRKPCRNLTDDDISIKICYMLSEKLYLTMIIYRYSILKGFVTCYYCKNVITVFYSVVFTPHVLVYFWPKRHNFGGNELMKFCILS